VGGCSQPGGRGDVDDRSAAAFGHRAKDKLRGEHDRPQVQIERLLPLRRVRRREARLLDASGVVDQYADPARSIYGRPDPGPGTDIRADERPADPRCRGWPGLLAEIGDDHVHALRREPLRDPGANPVRASRHQSDLSLEVHGGIVCRGTDNSTHWQFDALAIRRRGNPAGKNDPRGRESS
jgi:hypothetical protein